MKNFIEFHRQYNLLALILVALSSMMFFTAGKILYEDPVTSAIVPVVGLTALVCVFFLRNHEQEVKLRKKLQPQLACHCRPTALHVFIYFFSMLTIFIIGYFHVKAILKYPYEEICEISIGIIFCALAFLNMKELLARGANNALTKKQLRQKL